MHVIEVADASREPNEQVAFPRCDDKVRLAHHGAHAPAVVDWAALSKCRSVVEFDHGVHIKVVPCPVINHD